ncbi:phosphatase PAP2 family protein [Mucilaginibacter psychrotolerans]|uniref:Phosphatase PAP2 family protein n=1 Tax=Mucilaginibacter psychrotolerans TaxID=1524096 RepID=A0A4Y8S8Q9_9SPHI|nr:phosphatase PAP2 family protein [Mucilaginibacter psychrotolerans]TFF35041.1 phosphatase PAP2 family protein [Mucilaginibacter psychrotolerans]
MKTGFKEVLFKIRYFFIPYLAVLCACLVIKLLYSKEQIYFAVNGIYNSLFDFLAPYVTDIGDGLSIILLSAILLFFSYRSAFLLASSYLVTSIVAQAIKYSVYSPRPRIYFEDQIDKLRFVKDVYVVGGIQSFPSGHTVTAFSAGVAIAYLIQNKLWGMALLLVAILVGYSRMYLSQHFFEDVTAGSVIGVFVTVAWLSFIDSKKFIKSPRWHRGIIKRWAV